MTQPQPARPDIGDLERDNRALVTALRNMESAVNRSVSGMKVDAGTWLQLIHEARAALGDRVSDETR